MKIVLVFPPFYLQSMYNLPPLGLIRIATSLKDQGHDIAILDFVLAIRQGTLSLGRGIYQDCARRIAEEHPDFVGFSAQCTTYPPVVHISRNLKALIPDVKIVVGGHNASFVDRWTLEAFPFIDAIVRGEGEIGFSELVSAYNGTNGPGRTPGVTYRDSGGIVRNQDRPLIRDLDSLPLPDYGFLPDLSAYRDACGLSRSIAILEVGRGCPHRCIYCSESLLWRRRTRTFSAARIVEEMKTLASNYGAECFLLAYDQFTAHRGFVEEFCHRVMEAGLNRLPWYCISRLDSVDAPLLSLMREAGCESMCYGIDSGSRRTLRFIRKSIDHGILYRRVVETAEAGIIPTLSFVIGFPEEQKEDIDATLTMALRTGIEGNNNPLIQMPTVLPGTDLYKRYSDRMVRRVDTYFAMGLEFHEGRRLDQDEALIDSSPAIFSSFYNLLSDARPLEELRLIADHFPLMVRLFPKTFLLLKRETRESVSDLFLRWLERVHARTERSDPALTARDCYLYFGQFVSEILDAENSILAEHLPEMLRYEQSALEVAQFAREGGDFFVDRADLKGFKPRKRRNVLLEEFAFDLPGVISDMKNGLFNRRYPHRRTFLLFQQDGDVLEVSEVNDFVKEFIECCTGERTLEEISRFLYDQHGRDHGPERFLDTCMEAARTLGKSRILR